MNNGRSTIFGSINASCCQFGESKFLTTGTDISQDPPSTFSDYYYRYIIEPTAEIKFTMGKIENPMQVGYTCMIKNVGQYNINVHEKGNDSLATIILPGTTIKLIAKSSGSPDVWEVGTLDCLTFIQNNGSRLNNTPHAVLNFTGSGVSVSDSGNRVATVNISAGGSNESEYLSSSSSISTTSSSFKTGIDFTTTLSFSLSKKYLVLWQYEATNSSYYSYSEVRILFGGNNIHQQFNNFVYQFSTNDRYGLISGFTQLTGLSGTQEIEFQLRSSNNTGYMRNPSVFIMTLN